MKAIADYHTHTVYSHGRGTIEDNVKAALSRGLEIIGITDHGPGHFFIGIRGVSAFRKMQREIERLRYKYPDIEILFGVEANIVDVDGTIDVSPVILRELDILLVGYHKLVMPQSLSAAGLFARNFLAGWTGRTTDALRRRNTAAITAAVSRYPIDAITHPGLQIDIDTLDLARACETHGTALEINSSYGEELDGFMQTAMQTGVKFVINSDAHTPDRVGEFDKSYSLVKRLGLDPARITNLEGNLMPKRRKLGA